MSDEPIDAQVVDEQQPQNGNGNGHALATVPAVPPQTLTVAPQVQAGELVERLRVIREAMETAMIEGVDYGVIPGTKKPTLLKPGSEKLGVQFQLDVQLANEQTWGPGDHLTVTSRATVFHAPTGMRLGYGEGLCTTRERKYAYRQQQRTCPECGKPAVIKGKAEYGGGWLCFKKKDGCGAKWPDGDQSIESQEVGEVENPDLPDLWNTILKMAEKRARVDAVLAVTGASALFTQDAEDGAPPPDDSPREPAGQQPPQQGRQAPKATAQPAQRSERPASAAQKGAINGRAAAAGLSKKQLQAATQWVAGVAIIDRLSSQAASKLIDRLGKDGEGAEKILADLIAEATSGDDRAQKIVARYLTAGGA